MNNEDDTRDRILIGLFWFVVIFGIFAALAGCKQVVDGDLSSSVCWGEGYSAYPIAHGDIFLAPGIEGGVCRGHLQCEGTPIPVICEITRTGTVS